ncbi:NUDIX hydrolase [Brachybacterium hainanense]|uniref:NUDIX domain-containing protein n=1 Tax=Brachybacterium hainanense TaxID=1541174 RepID=A0ABV6RDP0_9MICO
MDAAAAPLDVAVDLVVLTLRGGKLSVLLVQREDAPFAGAWALPGGFVRPEEDLLAAAHRVLDSEASLGREHTYLEQLRTYGDADRDPRGRVISVVHMALGANLPDPVSGDGAADARFWDLAEIDAGALAFDHAEILTAAVERARSKLEYTTLATSFLPAEFTISQLRGVYESVWGTSLDPGNFHRKATRSPGFVVDLGKQTDGTGGRPARLFSAGEGAILNPPLLRGGE